MAIINVGHTQVYTTINSAYNAASSGDILLIDDGIYDEQLVMNDKWVHLKGNTSYPNKDKVIIRQLSIENSVLYLSNIDNSPIIYIEGIKFIWKPRSNESSNSAPIQFYKCYGATIFFNKCVIDASCFWKYIFNSNINDIYRLNLYNCVLFWYNDGSTHYFDVNGKNILVDIKKSILTYMVELIDGNYFSFPNGRQNNLLNELNTTGDFDNILNMFDMDTESYASVSAPTIGQVYYIYIDLGDEKIINRFLLESHSSYYYDKMELYASNNELDWDLIQTWEKTSYQLRYVDLYITSYRYFKVALTAKYSTKLVISTLVFLEKGNDILGYDYVMSPGKYGYGNKYGTYQLSTPPSYIFKGVIDDAASKNLIIDSVTFDPSNISNKVVLSNNDHTAMISTTYKDTYYGIRATVGRSTGKWYWEFKVVSGYNKCRVGIATYNASLYTALGTDYYGWGYEYASGEIFNGSNSISSGPIADVGSIIGIAYDAFNGKIWFSLDGEWFFNGSPVTGEYPTIEVQAELFPMVSIISSNDYSSTINFYTNELELHYPIPVDYSFYGTNVVWKVKAIDVETNVLSGYTYSNPTDNSYELVTTYSGAQFLICEDASSDPVFNDLIIGRIIPEVNI